MYIGAGDRYYYQISSHFQPHRKKASTQVERPSLGAVVCHHEAASNKTANAILCNSRLDSLLVNKTSLFESQLQPTDSDILQS